MKIFSKLTRFSDWGLLAIRLGVGIVFIAHGTLKWSTWGMQPSEQLPASMFDDSQISFHLRTAGWHCDDCGILDSSYGHRYESSDARCDKYENQCDAPRFYRTTIHRMGIGFYSVLCVTLYLTRRSRKVFS